MQKHKGHTREIQGKQEENTKKTKSTRKTEGKHFKTHNENLENTEIYEKTLRNQEENKKTQG